MPNIYGPTLEHVIIDGNPAAAVAAKAAVNFGIILGVVICLLWIVL